MVKIGFVTAEILLTLLLLRVAGWPGGWVGGRVGGWIGGWVVSENGNKAISASIEVEVELS